MLRRLPHPHVPAEYSPGGRLRVAELQRFLVLLHNALAQLRPIPPVTLYVLDEHDWRRFTRLPYGYPFQRSKPGEGHGVFAPLRYPDRLLERLTRVFAEAARRGGRLPGPLVVFLDLMIAHEYAHAVAVAWGLRARVRWVDEFLANYLYLLALYRSDRDLYGQARAWAKLASRLEPERRSLSGFERYPRRPLAEQLWFQGVFTLEAARMIEESGDRFVRRLLATAPLSRRDLHRKLLAAEPGLKAFFRTFGEKVT
ncbi:hypothetical protein [Oceanithermus sp.]